MDLRDASLLNSLGMTDARRDCVRIWQAGVAAVDSQRLVRDCIKVTPATLKIVSATWPLESIQHIEVVGAGKAGAGMAAGVADALRGSALETRYSGWVNVPADCVPSPASTPADSTHIHLHAARPAGLNEPHPEGVQGAREILRRVAALGSNDVCLVLISGGGSALLPLPRAGITLADKLQVTKALSRAGATIEELNAVRRELSDIKGGGLLRACRAGRLVTLVISDVTGDPLEVIASGPTMPFPRQPAKALQILRSLLLPAEIPAAVMRLLEADVALASSVPPEPVDLLTAQQFLTHRAVELRFVIGNNKVAVDAAAREARALGYDVRILGWDQAGIASEEGVSLMREALRIRDSLHTGDRPVCLISGGEPVVYVNPSHRPQLGGRNQELALAALVHALTVTAGTVSALERITLLSAGTDGEDGPTDAAGAIIDQPLLTQMENCGLDPKPHLLDNNAYPFFDQVGGLLRTGPTHTNVMDLRVVLIGSP